MCRLSVVLLLVGSSGGCVVSELTGEWNMAVHRVTLEGHEPVQIEDSGFLQFGSAVYHAWSWRYDPFDREFYAQLDPPVLTGSVESRDLDEPEPVILEWEEARIGFLPEARDDGIWLVAEDVSWPSLGLLTVELKLERPY